jgi:mannose-6-phosphate isomerase
MVWGGRRLGDVLHKPLSEDRAYGESWEVSDHPLHHSKVSGGLFRGKTLRHIMEQNRQELLGPAGDKSAGFPWLIKFLDCNDWLSVQVHPDETAVRRLWPGEGSKTEAWFVLTADPGSRIYAGLRPGVDEVRMRAALADGRVSECLHQFRPRPGDCVFLPAGTVHAVGGGVLMAEIQQTSDATFRLYDWDRKDAEGKSRQLHVEESMASIHWDQGPVTPITVVHFDRENADNRRPPLIQCPYFHLEYVEQKDAIRCGVERLQVLIVVKGQGQLRSTRTVARLTTGQVWVLPAACPPVECVPAGNLGLLLATLP